MVAGSLLKFSIGLIGLAVTLLILIQGLVRRDHSKIKRAVVTFALTWLILLIIGVIELLAVI